MMEPSRYELLAEIASGDFAVVYRGRDRELGREVAIKQIHQQYLNDSRTLERFWREAQLLASLEHRNIMTIYDMVRSRGWLILELMPASLQKYAQGEPLDLDLLRVVLSCSLQALQYLHANNIIHGDIKPSNLFVDKRLWVKVGDFGLARRASNEQGSMLKGTTQLHGAGTGLAAVRPRGTGQRSVFAGLLGLRADVRIAVRCVVSRHGCLRPRQADRLDDVARGSRPADAGDQPRAGRAFRTTCGT